MEEQIGVRDEITLSELFKILCRKALVLILALVIGVIAGGVFGFITTWNVHYYGTTVKFYINPAKSEDASSETGSQYGVYGAYGKQVMDSIVELLESESFSETLMLDNNGFPVKGISDEIDALIVAKDKQGAIEAWRETDNYKSVISLVSASTTYSFTTGTSAEDTLAKSFVSVDISVLNNENSAKVLLERVKEKVPAYIIENMIKPDGYDKTNCQRITRLDDVKLLNPDETKTTAVKYGVLLGALTFIAACVAVVILDYSDKRLRNFERTMNQLGMPVLGVIPTIVEKTEKAVKEQPTRADVSNKEVE
ncbi:MAG: hypothetical protein IJW60_00100 [Clostridia bacterium]|nr:hypothetical protein [Clostridia bacterium]